MKKLLYSLMIICCLFSISSPAWAQEKGADADTEALIFSDINDLSAVDSLAGIDTAAVSNALQQINTTVTPQAHHLDLFTIFLGGLLGGFAAVLLPCIFPMLPLTVGFFTKRNQSRRKGILDALTYGLSIILIYVGLGILITIIFGADALNALATNGIFNFAFFLLLVLFAASFFGAFEITLPGSWLNKIGGNSGQKGFTGIFFMAAALALVSFSCTGPIIGTLLVEAAVSGARLGPAIRHGRRTPQ